MPRQHGHKVAKVNPVAFDDAETSLPELQLSRYGLGDSLSVNFDGIVHLPGRHDGTIQEAVDHLKAIYTDTIAAEFMYLEVSKLSYKKIQF